MGAHRIGLIVVDEHTAIREAVRIMSEDTAELEFLGGASTIWQELPGGDAADAVLVGIARSTEIPDLAEVHARSPRARVILLVEEEDERLPELLRAGADAVVSKRAPVHRIVDVVRRTAAGLTQTDVLGDGEPPGTRLSRREREVLALLALGRTNREIAATLGIASRTIASHIASIYRKLGVSGRLDATRRALEMGIAPADPMRAPPDPAAADT